MTQNVFVRIKYSVTNDEKTCLPCRLESAMGEKQVIRTVLLPVVVARTFSAGIRRCFALRSDLSEYVTSIRYWYRYRATNIRIIINHVPSIDDIYLTPNSKLE
jgi:hypothetical protein